MDTCQVFGLRISMVVARTRLDDRVIVYAVHTWLHGLRMENNARRLFNGKPRIYISSFQCSIDVLINVQYHCFILFQEIQVVGTNRRRRGDSSNENGPAVARANTPLTATGFPRFLKELIVPTLNIPP